MKQKLAVLRANVPCNFNEIWRLFLTFYFLHHERCLVLEFRCRTNTAQRLRWIAVVIIFDKTYLCTSYNIEWRESIFGELISLISYISHLIDICEYIYIWYIYLLTNVCEFVWLKAASSKSSYRTSQKGMKFPFDFRLFHISI